MKFMSYLSKLMSLTRAKVLILLLIFQANLFASPTARDLPHQFKMGFATAAYHIYGADYVSSSNWSEWEKLGARPCDGKPTIDHNQRSDNACGFYQNIDAEIAGLLETKSKVYRFSIDWTQLFPTEENFKTLTPNPTALAHYHKLLDTLHDHKIMPIVTLHHFVHPAYFDKKGAFEKEENIVDLVRFAQFIATEFGDKINYIVTINEPGPYYVQGYLRGEFPPGKCAFQCPATPMHWSAGLTLAGTVLKNILFAHVEMYKAIKAINPNIQVGLAHNVMHFEGNQWWNPLDTAPAFCFDYVFNTPIMRFLQTGVFKFHAYAYARVESNKYEGQKFQDYIGLNYYSRIAVCAVQQTTHRTGEVMTDMPYAMVPESFYTALAEVATLGLPIIVTEAGLADQDNRIREKWFKEHIAILSQAIKNGIDVRGVTWWTLTDNFEWNNGFVPKFGIYAMDRTDPNNIKFALRKSAVWLKDFMCNHAALNTTT